MEERRIVKLATPLPCGCWAGDADGEMCGKPATAALATRAGRLVGEWVLLPMCRECATKTAALYGILEEEGGKP